MSTITLSLKDDLAYKLRLAANQQQISEEEVLRRALEQYLQTSFKPGRQFTELYGIWKGVSFSDEDIKASEYQL